jgi:transcription elongation factor GreB
MSRAFVREDAQPSEEAEEPPAPVPHDRHACYITPEGFRRLQAELERLWKHERPRVTSEVAAAAAQGDRSENAEYIYGKKKLREIDRRIHFLTKRLDSVTVATERPADTQRVFFGAWVAVEDEDGAQNTFRIVGPDEIDPGQGAISVRSPIGQALLGKRVGDAVTVRRPRGETQLVIVGIRYEGG